MIPEEFMSIDLEYVSPLGVFSLDKKTFISLGA